MEARENAAHRHATTPGRRATVVGAGIAGLAAALRLHQQGWDVVVVERAPSRRSSGYLVNLHGPGYAAAERLGLIPALTPRDIGFFTSVLVHADGRQKFAIPAAVTEAAVGSRALSLFRGDLESALYDAVADLVDIRFGTTVRAVAQAPGEVVVTLSDGIRLQAELVVGADGVHSQVRELVFGSEPEHFVDLGHMVGACALEAVPDHVPEGVGTTFLGPGRTAAVMNLGPERSSAFFAYRCPDPAAELALGAAPALTRAFGDLGGGVADALRQLEADPAAAYFDSVGQIVMNRWSHDRVVLLGDAAWCVTVFAGYGAALALDGADRLGAAVAAHGDDIPAALDAWESALRPEVHKRQALARRGISRFAPPSRAHVLAGELMLRAIQLPGIRGMVRRSIQRANN
ncbi:FAD-binding protein [Nocardia cyriacigeorgica]|uniref:FAD-binding protein n=1 Tax=Nocardia cyriacigeorgica TaxID=135487 RepID=A0A6P1D3W9_9NOCA|nr:FAD-dependent oxidoreductase [Nocardia cyriacigeorgica]NEW38637.1 FAD-binding protein [Nocardia cyriacigeorgica]NEW45276.1 FAD-binding protein [Nocardia cyriacigeorgica]NEW49660.1 FAD-binding protein [Nocardia cyriacigeorgica]NEW57275.1 FAD-binding protein [Nocardia cyriacigeorgica]